MGSITLTVGEVTLTARMADTECQVENTQDEVTLTEQEEDLQVKDIAEDEDSTEEAKEDISSEDSEDIPSNAIEESSSVAEENASTEKDAEQIIPLSEDSEENILAEGNNAEVQEEQIKEEEVTAIATE